MEIKDLTVVIATFKSENKIYTCLDSLPVTTRILVIENSNNHKFKEEINRRYSNVECILLGKNKGYSIANNTGLQKVITRFTATIWADQIYIENETINKTIIYFEKSKSLFTFPVFFKKNPYTKIIRNKSKKFLDIVQSKEIDYTLKSGESDCGFFIFKTSKIRKLIKYLINKKMIFSKKSNEIEFLSTFKYIRKLGKITTVKAKNEKDTIGINFKKDLI